MGMASQLVRSAGSHGHGHGHEHQRPCTRPAAEAEEAETAEPQRIKTWVVGMVVPARQRKKERSKKSSQDPVSCEKL